MRDKQYMCIINKMTDYLYISAALRVKLPQQGVYYHIHFTLRVVVRKKKTVI